MLAVILIFLYLCWETWFASYQAELIKKGIWINHAGYAFLEMIVILFLTSIYTAFIWKLQSLYFYPFILSLRWWYFDLILNIFRGLSIFYISAVSVHSSWLDTILVKTGFNKPVPQWILKLSLICIFAFLTFK